MRTIFTALIVVFIFSTSLFGQDYSSDAQEINNKAELTHYSIFDAIFDHKEYALLGAFLMLCLLFSIFKIRVKRLEKRQMRLEEEVKKRTETIEKDKQVILAQAKYLKELDKNKTQFFSNIAHEIRTPLTLIMGPLQQLIEEQPPKSQVQKKLSNISSNANQLLLMTNQLLGISKIENGKFKSECRWGDIASYTRELVSRFETVAENKKIDLKNIEHTKVWHTNFDADQWSKIIHNLLSNAIKFTDAGGRIEVLLSDFKKESNAYISLLVRDSGIGMTDAQINKIYDRFYQVNGSTTREQGGSGIGLSLVKELVDLQGGKIYVSSEIGVGTEFRILLPIKQKLAQGKTFAKKTNQHIAQTKAIDMEVPGPGNFAISKIKDARLRVLIIEDNAAMRAFIKSCLVQQKFAIQEAEDGVAGLEKALTNPPDLIISDVMMPKKDGYELTKELRQNLKTAHIPIILLTAKIDPESYLEGLKLGADAVLTKPFNPHELTLRIENLLKLRERIHYKCAHPEQFSENGKEAIEDEFVQKIRNFVLENIETSNLNGDVVGKHMNMSRVHLHRKLKAITGQPITEFVKEVRLKKAMEMMQTKRWNVSEVTYKTGFSSISHFSRSFKQAYGKAPSEV